MSHTTLHHSCHSSLLRNLTTESIFGANRSSLPSRLDVHEDNVKIRRDKNDQGLNTSVSASEMNIVAVGNTPE